MERIDKTKNQDQPDIQVIETGQVGEGQVLYVVDAIALQIDRVQIIQPFEEILANSERNS